MSNSVPKQFPPAKSGWFYLGTPECKLDADVDALERAESVSAPSEAATSEVKKGGVEACDKHVEPEVPSKYIVKYGKEEALARHNAKTIPASGMRKGGKSKGKGSSKKSFLAKVYNPQASRPFPTLRTPLQEYRTTMTASFLQYTNSAAIPTYNSTYLVLTTFPEYTGYVALFDEYKIETIELWIEPGMVMSPTVGSTEFASAVDLDDANVPASYGDVAARQGAITSLTGTGHYHKWKPYVANALYSGAFTSYGSEPAPWIDCASSTVQHFGIKTATSAADGMSRPMYYTWRAVVAFRGPAI
jgi:hypothetical protein